MGNATHSSPDSRLESVNDRLTTWRRAAVRSLEVLGDEYATRLDPLRLQRSSSSLLDCTAAAKLAQGLAHVRSGGRLAALPKP